MNSTESIELASKKKMCFVTGWLQLKLIEKANEGNMAANPGSETRSGVGAAIERLEGNLNK